mgnify:CR=1 FL=1
MVPRLKELIVKDIQPSLKEKFGYKNLYMGPRIEKVVLNMGLGLDGNDTKIVSSCQDDLASITGQRPIVTKFRKSIANFKTRKNTTAGIKVTLRKNMMYEFIDRLINIALPRIKDFRGLNKKGFDKLVNPFSNAFRVETPPLPITPQPKVNNNTMLAKNDGLTRSENALLSEGEKEIAKRA